jgi:hypothetical protein
MTLNTINTATNYLSGDELLVEWALTQHLPFNLAAGVEGRSAGGDASGRWFHEFDVQNRVRGDSLFDSLSFKL